MESAQRITEEEISNLVDRFYAKVRLDSEIGPVFNAAVHNWDAHLALLKDFWSTVMLGSGRYKGNPMLAHFALPIRPHYFARWLQLFRETAQDNMAASHAVLIIRRAEQIGANMKHVIGEWQSMNEPAVALE